MSEQSDPKRRAELNLPGEIWKDIPDLVNYQVSNFGRVKSLGRKVRAFGHKFFYSQDRIMRLRVTNKGYHGITIIIKRVKHSRQVHRLVCAAFHPNPFNLPQVNHKDFNKVNNHVDNLEWVTNLENIRHAWRNDRFPHKLKKAI